MSDRFVVEANKSVVGIGVKVPGGFMFFSSNPDFDKLEGKTFRRARSMVHRVTKLARLHRENERRAVERSQ